MKKSRIVLGLLLAVVLVLGVAGYVLAAAEFTDIEDNDYNGAILNMTSHGFAGGYADQTFRPDNPLQRQQFAKMAVLTLGYPVTAANVSTFPDTPPAYDAVNNPLYPGSYVAVAAANNLISGYTSGNFGFVDNVTRQQVISIAVRAAGAALTAPTADYVGVCKYTDPNHGANVKKAEFNGMLDGIKGLATWDLTANATRGEASEIMTQVFIRTGKVLKITGPTGTKEFTMAELWAMPNAGGFGGTKNKAGTLSVPALYKGVPVKDLLALVGGGTTASVIALDGYKVDYTADEVNGVIAMYSPTTGEEITTINGKVTMIVAYQTGTKLFGTSGGALRIAFVSQDADQLTMSNKWAKLVAEIKAP
jgi:hypothetical protein